MLVVAQSRIFIYFLLLSSIGFSQKQVIKKFTSENNKITIATEGLDSFVIENTTSKFIEVILHAENPTKQHILVDEKDYETVIKFQLPVVLEKEIIFRKFITERLQRAKAVIRIPVNKQVIIFGDNIDVTSKGCKNNLEIYLENGIVKFKEVQGNVLLKLYSGNVYASLKKSTINIVSNNGAIKVDEETYEKKYVNSSKNHTLNFTANSLKANFFIDLE